MFPGKTQRTENGKKISKDSTYMLRVQYEVIRVSNAILILHHVFCVDYSTFVFVLIVSIYDMIFIDYKYILVFM